MEITKFSARGYEFSAIFTGDHYFFHSDYYGLIAIAERIRTEERGRELFALTYGSHHTDGGSLSGHTPAEIAKRFIKKSENKYVKKLVEFSETKRDLADSYLNIQPVIR